MSIINTGKASGGGSTPGINNTHAIWAYQDFAAGVITSSPVTLTANENGTSPPFVPANIRTTGACISRSDSFETLVFETEFPAFENKIQITGIANEDEVSLNLIPLNTTPVRIWYQINITGLLPNGYTTPPKQISSSALEELKPILIDQVFTLLIFSLPAVSWDVASLGKQVKLILTGNTFIQAPTNIAPGKYSFLVQQDLIGNRDLEFDVSFQFTGIDRPTLSTIPHAINTINMVSKDGKTFQCEMLPEATDLTGIKINLQGQSLNVGNGNSIDSWTNTEGTNFTASGSASPNQTDNAINGFQVATFDGVNDRLLGESIDFTDPENGFSLFMTTRQAATIQLGVIFSQFSDDTVGSKNQQARVQFFIAADGSIGARVFSLHTDFVGRITNAAEVTSTSIDVLNFNYDGGTSASSVSIFVNNVAKDTADSNGGAAYSGMQISTIPMEIGSQDNGTDFYKGDILDVLLINRTLSSQEISYYNKKLGGKAGIF